MVLPEGKFLVFISTTLLQIIPPSGKTIVYTFPPGAVTYGELSDEKLFTQGLNEVISNSQLKGKAVIVLSNQFVFSEEIEDSEKKGENEKRFYQYIPINRAKIAKLTVKKGKKIELLAANSDLYKVVIETLKVKNIGVSAVVPLSIITNREVSSISVTDAKGILKNGSVLNKYNLLKAEKISKEEADGIESELNIQTPKPNLKYQYVTLVIGLVILVAVSIYALIQRNLVTNPFAKDQDHAPQLSLTTSDVTLTLSPTVLLSPTIKSPDKSAIKIQILNGSGIKGQAGEMGLILNASGYKNISIGNARALENQTTLTYSEQFSSELVKDIQNVLRSDFPLIIVEEATQSAEFDIVITIGKD